MKKKKLTLVEWCDQQVAEGHELSITWDGGGDSGWAEFKLDGSEYNDEYTEELVGYMYDELDYGSWAGEFTATGTAIYNSETKCFEGVDNYSEDKTINWDTDIKIRVPKTIWFDILRINIEDEEITVRFHIKNGYLSDEHAELEEKIQTYIREEVDKEKDKFSEMYAFRSLWENIDANGSEFIEDGDDLIFTIKSLDMGTYSEIETDIVLNVSDIDEFIKDDNNEEE